MYEMAGKTGKEIFSFFGFNKNQGILNVKKQAYDYDADHMDVFDDLFTDETSQTNRKKNKKIKKDKNRNKDDDKPKKPKKSFGKRLLQIFLILMALSILFTVVMLYQTTKYDNLWLNLDQVPYKNATILYYENKQTGEQIEFDRIENTAQLEYVDGSQIPDNLRNAFIATEDQQFYKHGGVNFVRTVYAGVNEVIHIVTGKYISGKKIGASTIDQQLVKNLTRDEENSKLAGYLRKIREIYRALKLDNEYEKDEILNAYMNVISFTGNTVGVQAEAKKLFNKPVSQLTLVQCASIAGITRSPKTYDPVANPDKNKERRDFILSEMLAEKMITQQEYDEAINAPLNLNYQGEEKYEEPVKNYFTDMVMQNVKSSLMKEKNLSEPEARNLIYNGGLRINTTVVPELQTQMEYYMSAKSGVYPTLKVQKPQLNDDNTIKKDSNGNIVYSDEMMTPQAAMISLSYDGGVSAVVGGLGEKEGNLVTNRATSTSAARQVGSTMKAIAPYTLAIEKNKINWSTSIMDSPVKQIKDEATNEKRDWPVNFDKTYAEKEILVNEAFAESINTVAVRVGQKVGLIPMYKFVRYDLGISTFTFKDLDYGPLVLGSSTHGITPQDMAMSFAMFGNGGKKPTVHSFTSVKNAVDDTFIEVKLKETQVIDSSTAYIMNRLMKGVMTGSGTASGYSVPGQMDSVGKTGTSSNNIDHWFVGLTPYYVTASWYGYDVGTPLSVNYQSHPAILSWQKVMSAAQKNLPAIQFPVDNSVVEKSYCTGNGKAATSDCRSAVGYYKPDNLPA